MKSDIVVPEGLGLELISDFVHGTERVLVFNYYYEDSMGDNQSASILVKSGNLTIDSSFKAPAIVLPLKTLKYPTEMVTTI